MQCWCRKGKDAESSKIPVVISLITHWEKLLDSDWLRACDFIRNLRANSVIRCSYRFQGQIIIHSECKYEKELTINDQRSIISN